MRISVPGIQPKSWPRGRTGAGEIRCLAPCPTEGQACAVGRCRWGFGVCAGWSGVGGCLWGCRGAGVSAPPLLLPGLRASHLPSVWSQACKLSLYYVPSPGLGLGSQAWMRYGSCFQPCSQPHGESSRGRNMHCHSFVMPLSQVTQTRWLKGAPVYYLTLLEVRHPKWLAGLGSFLETKENLFPCIFLLPRAAHILWFVAPHSNLCSPIVTSSLSDLPDSL